MKEKLLLKFKNDIDHMVKNSMTYDIILKDLFRVNDEIAEKILVSSIKNRVILDGMFYRDALKLEHSKLLVENKFLNKVIDLIIEKRNEMNYMLYNILDLCLRVLIKDGNYNDYVSEITLKMEGISMITKYLMFENSQLPFIKDINKFIRTVNHNVSLFLKLVDEEYIKSLKLHKDCLLKDNDLYYILCDVNEEEILDKLILFIDKVFEIDENIKFIIKLEGDIISDALDKLQPIISRNIINKEIKIEININSLKSMKTFKEKIILNRLEDYYWGISIDNKAYELFKRINSEEYIKATINSFKSFRLNVENTLDSIKYLNDANAVKTITSCKKLCSSPELLLKAFSRNKKIFIEKSLLSDMLKNYINEDLIEMNEDLFPTITFRNSLRVDLNLNVINKLISCNYDYTIENNILKFNNKSILRDEHYEAKVMNLYLFFKYDFYKLTSLNDSKVYKQILIESELVSK